MPALFLDKLGIALLAALGTSPGRAVLALLLALVGRRWLAWPSRRSWGTRLGGSGRQLQVWFTWARATADLI